MSDKSQTQEVQTENQIDVQAIINALSEQRNALANENALLRAQLVSLRTRMEAGVQQPAPAA